MIPCRGGDQRCLFLQQVFPIILMMFVKVSILENSYQFAEERI